MNIICFHQLPVLPHLPWILDLEDQSRNRVDMQTMWVRWWWWWWCWWWRWWWWVWQDISDCDTSTGHYTGVTHHMPHNTRCVWIYLMSVIYIDTVLWVFQRECLIMRLLDISWTPSLNMSERLFSKVSKCSSFNDGRQQATRHVSFTAVHYTDCKLNIPSTYLPACRLQVCSINLLYLTYATQWRNSIFQMLAANSGLSSFNLRRGWLKAVTDWALLICLISITFKISIPIPHTGFLFCFIINHSVMKVKIIPPRVRVRVELLQIEILWK